MAAAIAKLIKVEVDDRINKSAHCDFVAPTCEHAKRRDDGDTHVGLHKSNLCIEQLYDLPTSGNAPTLAQLLVDH
jgi:hypothetical protein